MAADAWSGIPMLPKSLWQKIIVTATGPLVAAVVGGIAAKLIVERVEHQRNMAELAAQDRLHDYEMKLGLIKEMSTALNGLYFALQDYSRQLERSDLPADTKASLRSELDGQYRESGIAAAEIETRLKVLFKNDDPGKFWHAARDILQVRYFQLIWRESDKEKLDRVYVANARDVNQKEWHTGLTKAELERSPPEDLMSAYHDRLDKAVQAVLTWPVVRIGINEGTR